MTFSGKMPAFCRKFQLSVENTTLKNQKFQLKTDTFTLEMSTCFILTNLIETKHFSIPELKCFVSARFEIRLWPSEPLWCFMGVVVQIPHAPIFLCGWASQSGYISYDEPRA